jgi:hypothetical protein
MAWRSSPAGPSRREPAAAYRAIPMTRTAGLHRSGDRRHHRRMSLSAERQSGRSGRRLQRYPTDLDVYASEPWVDDALFRPEVRDAYRRLVAQGWTDALRALHPDERIYTFWKYFRNAFGRAPRLRIDHLLLSPSLAGRLVAAGVDRDARAREKGERSRARLDRTCGCKHWITAAGATPEAGLMRLMLRSTQVAKGGGNCMVPLLERFL